MSTTEVRTFDVVKQALNTTEVREALKQKGIVLTDKSLFTVSDDKTTVKIDIDGDGIMDKYVRGLVTESGSINTKASKLKVGDETVSTATIDKKNADIAALDATIAEKTKATEASFNEQEAKQAASEKYDKKLQEYKEASEKAENAVKAQKEKYNSEMTSEEYKKYAKELDKLEKAAEKAKKQYEKFQKQDEKEQFIQNEVEQAKAKFDSDNADAKKQLKKAQARRANYQTAYNDFLYKNGYKKTEERRNVKAKQTSKKGSALGATTTKDAIIESTVRKFVETKKQLQQSLGDNYRIEIKGSTVILKANDGDDRADYVITGLYDEKTGELSTDSKNIRFESAKASTVDVKAKIQEYKEARKKLDDMLNNFSSNPKEIAKMQNEVNRMYVELKAMGVKPEELKNNN